MSDIDHAIYYLETVGLHHDAAAVREQRAQLSEAQAALKDPIKVFVNMQRGIIAKPPFRGFLDLYGEVFNDIDSANVALAEVRWQLSEARARLALQAQLAEALRLLAHGLPGNRWDVGLGPRLEKARAVIAEYDAAAPAAQAAQPVSDVYKSGGQDVADDVVRNAATTRALRAAVSAIYFDDGSDYRSALWTVVAALGGNEVVSMLEENDRKAYLLFGADPESLDDEDREWLAAQQQKAGGAE